MKRMISMIVLGLLGIVPAHALDLSDTKKSDISLSDDEKAALCEEFSEDNFCGSKIDRRSCLDDFKFEARSKHVKGEPKLVVNKKYKMKSRDRDFKWTKTERHDIVITDGKASSRYRYDRFSIKGRDAQGFEPSFILDPSCKGDDDGDD